MLTNPNALITDPEEVAKYTPQGPGEAATISTHEVRSGMNSGPAFAKADKAAGDRLYQYCVAADEGVTGYVNEAAKSTTIYMNADQQSSAHVQGIIQPLQCYAVDIPDQAAPAVAGGLPSSAPDLPAPPVEPAPTWEDFTGGGD
jgi:hypothetical protein